ncbi:hypothetical protein ACPYO6_10455 [Georgenia sp. Z1344]|uniref:hypothetical protein n=1 Tax=Georgenia sp. Z1344 TaxID=3416706 RepID=UPI003CF623BA
MFAADIPPADLVVDQSEIVIVEHSGAARSAGDDGVTVLVEPETDPAALPLEGADSDATASPDSGKGKPGKIIWRPYP